MNLQQIKMAAILYIVGTIIYCVWITDFKNIKKDYIDLFEEFNDLYGNYVSETTIKVVIGIATVLMVISYFGWPIGMHCKLYSAMKKKS